MIGSKGSAARSLAQMQTGLQARGRDTATVSGWSEEVVAHHTVPSRYEYMAEPMQWTLFQWGSKVSTNRSNTWKHGCYCAFMYTFTEKHTCFHVISLLILVSIHF